MTPKGYHVYILLFGSGRSPKVIGRKDLVPSLLLLVVRPLIIFWKATSL